MKILLINPPDDITALLGSGASLVSSLEPLGLLYIAASCREQGHTPVFIDAQAEGMGEEELFARIKGAQTDVVGFSSFISNSAFLYTFGQRLKRELPNLTIIFGNIQAESYAHEFVANNCCDMVVKGEGEEITPAILDALESGRPEALSKIPGLVLRHEGKIVDTGEAPPIKDLGSIPLPARELTKPELYKPSKALNFSLYKLPAGKTMRHMFTSRGCVNRCEFCVAHKSLGIRLRPIDSVLEEVEILLHQYNSGYIFFMDSLFTSKKQRILDLCSALASSFPNLKWGCEAHVNFVDEEIIRAMDHAGCTDMNFGIESGVDRLLKNVNKHQSCQQIEKAVRLVKKSSKINCMGLFILGLPGETPQDTITTIKFATSLPLDMAQFSILTPYPGSPLFSRLRREKAIDDGIRPDGSIDYTVWRRYSAYASFSDNKPIWVTKEQSAEQLLAFQKLALRKFYFRPRQIYNQLRRFRISDIPAIAKSAWDVFF